MSTTKPQCDCQIEHGGQCPRHGVSKSARWVALCRQRGPYWQAWEQGRGPGQSSVSAWDKSQPARGVGDVIAKATSAVGIEPCGGCRQRQTWMNRMWRFRAADKYLPNNVALGAIEADTWISTARLAEDSAALAACLPGNVDAIVGVARSGLIPATILATWLHVPLYTLSASGVHGPTPLLDVSGGYRLQSTDRRPGFRTVLIVDDTAANGHTAAKVRQPVRAAFPGADVLLCAVYAHPRCLAALDFAGYQYDGLHYLEWNFLNAGHAERCATDLDGILCDDCPAEFDDDGPKYRRWMRRAAPLYRAVRRPLKLIVTARLEKYRKQTETWLQRHEYRYEQLVMGQWASAAERNAGDGFAYNVAKMKAEAYAASECDLFIESDADQARLIHETTGRRVLCPTLGRVIGYPRADKSTT